MLTAICTAIEPGLLRSAVGLDADARIVAADTLEVFPGYTYLLAHFDNRRDAVWAVDRVDDPDEVYAVNRYARRLTPHVSEPQGDLAAELELERSSVCSPDEKVPDSSH